MLTMPMSTPMNPLPAVEWCFGYFDGGVKEPLAGAVDEVGFADRTGAQQHELRGAPRSDPRNRPATVQIDTVAPRPSSSGTATTGTARRTAAPHRRGNRSDWTPPVAACRPGRTTVAGGDVGMQRGVGVGDLAYHPDRRLGGQPETSPQLGVEVVMGVKLAMHSLGVHRRRQPRRSAVARPQRGRSAAASDSVGSTRTFTTCFTLGTVTADADIAPTLMSAQPHRRPT